jgi:hypothetical protein
VSEFRLRDIPGIGFRFFTHEQWSIIVNFMTMLHLYACPSLLAACAPGTGKTRIILALARYCLTLAQTVYIFINSRTRYNYQTEMNTLGISTHNIIVRNFSEIPATDFSVKCFVFVDEVQQVSTEREFPVLNRQPNPVAVFSATPIGDKVTRLELQRLLKAKDWSRIIVETANVDNIINLIPVRKKGLNITDEDAYAIQLSDEHADHINRLEDPGVAFQRVRIEQVIWKDPAGVFHSPAIDEILAITREKPMLGTSLIYTEYVEDGTHKLCEYLQQKGVPKLTHETDPNDWAYIEVMDNSEMHLVNTRVKNTYILISDKYATGVNFNYATKIFLLTIPWNSNKEMQVVGRITRRSSVELWRSYLRNNGISQSEMFTDDGLLMVRKYRFVYTSGGTTSGILGQSASRSIENSHIRSVNNVVDRNVWDDSPILISDETIDGLYNQFQEYPGAVFDIIPSALQEHFLRRAFRTIDFRQPGIERIRI